MSPKARRGLQLIGYLGALGLLGWAAREALSPGNREALAKLGEAGPGPIAGLVALALASLVINGLAFWVVLRPVRRLDATGVTAVNAAATLLAYLPFKLSLVLRAAVHRTRDGIPIVTTAAWMAATSATVLIGVGAAGLAAWLVGAVDGRFAAVASAVAITGVAACVTGARFIAGHRGLHRLRAVAAVLRLSRFAEPVLRSAFFRHGHDGATMLASAGAVSAAVGLRLLDIGCTTGRFWVAAAAIGVAIEPAGAVALALAYFLAGAASPVGMVGTREATVVATAAVFGLGGDDAQREAFALVALIVTAAELVAALAGAAAAAAYLGPSAFKQGPRAGSPTIADNADRAGANEPDGR